MAAAYLPNETLRGYGKISFGKSSERGAEPPSENEQAMFTPGSFCMDQKTVQLSEMPQNLMHPSSFCYILSLRYDLD